MDPDDSREGQTDNGEIIQIMALRQFASPYIAHYRQVDKKQQGNYG